MNQQSTAAGAANGASRPHELFALTDEQILEIDPEGEVNVAPGFSPASPAPRAQGNAASPAVTSSEARNPSASDALDEPLRSNRDSSVASLPRNDGSFAGSPNTANASSKEHETGNTGHVASEPPSWLAAQMKDPWNGEEAKELWDGVQQSKQETAAYRAAFATPEEARALKELYPGGVSEARAAADRARLLEQIDQAYFGAAGGTPEQTGSARTQLAELMLHEDPAAFREMVFAGLRALEAAEKGTGPSFSAPNLPRLAQIFSSARADVNGAPPFSAASTPSSVGATLGSPPSYVAEASPGGARLPLQANAARTPHSAVAAGLPPSAASLVGTRHALPASASTSTNDAHVAAYAAFEKAANEDLESSVGAAITRTIEQALPSIGRISQDASGRAGQAPPLHDRLSAAIRQDVEAALKGDRQLGEQIAQILSARRFDNETRAQVVRLIDDRARQLVPGAARRVINEWTQTTLAAHRGSVARSDSASSRTEVEPAATHATVAQGLPAGQAGAGPAAFSSRAAQTRPAAAVHRNASRSDAHRLDYRKLSDEQILDL